MGGPVSGGNNAYGGGFGSSLVNPQAPYFGFGGSSSAFTSQFDAADEKPEVKIKEDKTSNNGAHSFKVKNEGGLQVSHKYLHKASKKGSDLIDLTTGSKPWKAGPSKIIDLTEEDVKSELVAIASAIAISDAYNVATTFQLAINISIDNLIHSILERTYSDEIIRIAALESLIESVKFSASIKIDKAITLVNDRLPRRSNVSEVGSGWLSTMKFLPHRNSYHIEILTI